MARSQLLVETDMYYPFATAGINITYLMVTLLHLSKGKKKIIIIFFYKLYF